MRALFDTLAGYSLKPILAGAKIAAKFNEKLTNNFIILYELNREACFYFATQS